MEFHYEISQKLSICGNGEWEVWEAESEEDKGYLAHIGKGLFDLHFRRYANCGAGELNQIELALHFYPNNEEIRESVEFTHTHASIISDMNFASFFGETDDYLIYENQLHTTQPCRTNEKLKQLISCIKDKLK